MESIQGNLLMDFDKVLVSLNGTMDRLTKEVG